MIVSGKQANAGFAIFQQNLEPDPGELRGLHQRCAASGLTRENPAVRICFGGEVLREKTGQFAGAIEWLERQEVIFAAAFSLPYVWMLADADGTVLFINGNMESLRQLERHRIGMGTSLGLISAGTTAVSACMELGRKILLSGRRHFLHFLSDWESYCMPIELDDQAIAAYFSCFVQTGYSHPIWYQCMETVGMNLRSELQRASTAKEIVDGAILEERLQRFGLTPREQQIAMYWMLDYDYRQIGKAIGISDNTVRVMITKINCKLKVNSKASMILRVLGAI